LLLYQYQSTITVRTLSIRRFTYYQPGHFLRPVINMGADWDL
jgi:hypothetical protein